MPNDPEQMVEKTDPTSEPTPIDRPDQFWCDVAGELVQFSTKVEQSMLDGKYIEAYDALRLALSAIEQLMGPLGPQEPEASGDQSDNASGHFTDMP